MDAGPQVWAGKVWSRDIPWTPTETKIRQRREHVYNSRSEEDDLELCHGTGAQCRSERSRAPFQAIDFSGGLVCWRREGDSNPR